MKLQAAALFAMVLLLSPPASAVLIDLTPTQVDEAVAHGRKTYEQMVADRRPIDDLDAENVVDLGPEIGKAMLFTEFSSVSLEVRRWLAIGQKPTPKDIEGVVSPVRGTLTFLVYAVGPMRDFLRHYSARLVHGGLSAEPRAWDVFRGEAVGGSSSRFRASARYVFTAKELDRDGSVTLILRGTDDHQLRFEFDLSRIR